MATSAKAGAGKTANLQAVPEGGEAPAPKKSKKKLIIIIAAALLVLGGGGGAAAYFLMGGNHAEPGKHAAPAEAKVDPKKPPVFINMEPFTVNLQSEGTDQFLQVSLTVQVPDQETTDVFKNYQPLVRSRLLLLLSSRKASEISSEAGKQKLAADIKAQLEKPFMAGLPPQKVTGVFFTSFVIQ